MALGESTLVFFLQILKEELRDFKGLKDGERLQFDLLGNDLLTLQAFLEDSVAVSDKNNLFRNTERKIRELAYEVEDTIEMCSTKKTAENTKNFLIRFGKWFSTSTAKQVQTLREEKVKPILDSIKDFGKIDRSTPSTSNSFTEVNLVKP
ncbi:putative disease resistance RPP13-like protein 3 [Salvia divinorum]|uniref:Disease resistance RPP13-like protein 3 n=1 Tax=Salvia divinorum TaxID=28513 RepID=A0ABD1IBV4_SALDI